MINSPLYMHMATAIDAMQRCKRDVALIRANALGAPDKSFLELREEWADRWERRLKDLLDQLPHGSGLDGDWDYVWDKCNANRIVLASSYHNMNAVGSYTGWSDITITVVPSLIHGITMRIVGGDSDLKDYLYDIVGNALNTVIEPIGDM